MKVTLIAHTTLALDESLTEYATDPWMERRHDGGSTDAEHLITFAGRACYQSFHRPNKATERDGDYIRSAAIDKGHGSILEHASATFYITGVSRSLTHELIRHRAGTAFSELSQRYVDVADVEFLMPPAVRDVVERAEAALGGRWDGHREWETTMREYSGDYQAVADLLIDAGLPRRRAREAARAVMPNCAETKIVMTANLRAWRHIIRLRGSEHADAEIRELALALLDQLYDLAPSVFSDFSVVTLPDGREVIA